MKIEVPFIACLLCLLALQVYGPHPIGMSDNGDYPKTLGRIEAWPADATQLCAWFITDYRIEPGHRWDPHYPTSEMLFVWTAARLARWLLPANHFDLRLIGTLHLAVFAFAAWLLFRAARKLPTTARIAAGLILLFVVSDVEYTQYLNTPYMDAASIVFLLVTFGVMVNTAVEKRRSWRWALAFTVAGALFLTAKLQHQACVAGLMLFAGVWAWRFAEGRSRAAWMGAGLVLVAVTIYMFAATPDNYRADAIFNLMVIDFAPRYSEPSHVIADLGLLQSDERYLDVQSAFAAGSPLADPAYRKHLLKSVPTSRLVGYYLRHPGIAASILRDKWLQYGPDICNSEMAQLRKVDHAMPFSRARKFHWWSGARGWLMRKVPLYPGLILLTTLLWSIAALFRKRPNPFAPALLSASVMSAASFFVAALADASDNSRHLIVFHVALDFCIVLAMIALIARLSEQTTLPLRLKQLRCKILQT